MNASATDQVQRHRVLILAPAGRDAVLAAKVLRDAGMESSVCSDMFSLCAGVAAGAGAAVVTEESLLPEAWPTLIETLARQPAWSDFPIIVFEKAGPRAIGRATSRTRLSALGNVTILERPINPDTMISAVHSALRARNRQYEAEATLKRLEDGVKERDQFLAMLGHELRNPLGAIRNALHLIGTESGDPRLERNLGIIARQAGHLTGLVDDLLDVARITRGKITLNKRVMDLRAIVELALQQLEPDIASCGLTAKLSRSPVSVFVNGDPVRLEQVFTNLLTNAIKYTPSGGHIDVEVAIVGGQAVVRVEDTGIGIPPRSLGLVFDLFRQADASLDRSKGGLGIGLTVVRGLVDLHGGSVAVSSDGEGKGSAFVVALPVAEPEVVVAEPQVAPVPAAFASRHILLVEDSDDNRESLQDLLEDFGHHVDVATDGREGVERTLALHPEIVLVDIGLPVLDGYEVARRIRKALGTEVFLVALTGYGQPDDRQRTAEAGFDAHFTKPADIQQLESLVRVARPTGARSV